MYVFVKKTITPIYSHSIWGGQKNYSINIFKIFYQTRRISYQNENILCAYLRIEEKCTFAKISLQWETTLESSRLLASALFAHLSFGMLDSINTWFLALWSIFFLPWFSFHCYTISHHFWFVNTLFYFFYSFFRFIKNILFSSWNT